MSEVAISTPTDDDTETKAGIYVISDETAVKVGWTTNIKKRVGVLQAYNPRELELLHFFELPDGIDPRVIEKAMHDALGGFRIRGEWFNSHVAPLAEAVYLNAVANVS